MAEQRVELPAKLLPLFSPKRFKVLYGGRGSAKSWSVARALVSIAASRKVKVLCARETQKSIDESVHALLKAQIQLLGLESQFEVQETRIKNLKTGSLFVFAGLRQQGIANIKSFEDVDICWVEEGDAVTNKSWEVLIPTIRKPGSEIWVTFNPELDTSATYQRFIVSPPDDSWVINVNYDDNPWFTGELEKARLDTLKRDPEGYKTIWMGQCRAAVEGAIYANEIAAMVQAGRYRAIPYDPMLPVHTAWDLGYNDNMSVIMFQKLSSEVRIIDHISESGLNLAEMVQQLSERKYRWGTDILPHDSKAHRYETGKSGQELLESLGRRTIALDADQIEQGIHVGKLLFPRVYLHNGCVDLYNNLRKYKRTLNKVTNTFGAPLHDNSSHDADAFRYLAMGIDLVGNGTAQKPLPIRHRRIA